MFASGKCICSPCHCLPFLSKTMAHKCSVCQMPLLLMTWQHKTQGSIKCLSPVLCKVITNTNADLFVTSNHLWNSNKNIVIFVCRERNTFENVVRKLFTICSGLYMLSRTKASNNSEPVLFTFRFNCWHPRSSNLAHSFNRTSGHCSMDFFGWSSVLVDCEDSF